jgi:hypothetical protein
LGFFVNKASTNFKWLLMNKEGHTYIATGFSWDAYGGELALSFDGLNRLSG